MSEQDLYAAILLAHSHGSTRLFRINAGIAYQGRVIERSPQRLVLSPYYHVRLGVEGVSDLLGWTTVNEVAVFTAIECKMGRRQATDEQLAFLQTVLYAGGRAGIARNVGQAAQIIGGGKDVQD